MLGDKRITGPLPVLEVDLTHCESGSRCSPRPGGHICRIHQIRQFLKELGWIEDPPEPPKVAA